MSPHPSPYDPAHEWGVYREVRKSTGAIEGPRYADVIAVRLYPAEGWDVEGGEVKRDLGDVDEELSDPEKSAPFRPFCRRWWLIAPTLIRDGILARLDRIPEAWGVLEVAGRKVHEIRPALDRRETEREDLPPGFVKSLLRAAQKQAHGDAPGMVAGVPLVPVGRTLSRTRVVLACNHEVDRPPFAKVRRGERPPPVPCVFCAEAKRAAAEEPLAPAVAAAAIARATPEELLVYERAVRARLESLEAQAELQARATRGAA